MAESSLCQCGHTKATHEVSGGYKPFGWCNFQHDLCGCREFRAANEIVVDKGCPVCNALPDEACVTPTGKPRNDHKGREYVTEAVDA